ncbi:hypothetical protein KHA80_03695 [Anaerobacillus sp. HL2]|nr:hypothetical protein KHA80_03695 [Anaerobacillus sp. HL2]
MLFVFLINEANIAVGSTNPPGVSIKNNGQHLHFLLFLKLYSKASKSLFYRLFLSEQNKRFFDLIGYVQVFLLPIEKSL